MEVKKLLEGPKETGQIQRQFII
jgi:tRNA pseudouridine-54 N-methylase